MASPWVELLSVSAFGLFFVVGSFVGVRWLATERREEQPKRIAQRSPQLHRPH